MEDMAQQINQILSDPDSMQQLQSVISSLGLGGGQGAVQPQAQAQPPAQQAPAPAAPDLSALLGALGGGQGQPAGSALANPQLLGAMTKLMPLLGQAGREDDSTRLLRALRPLLGPERQKKVDEAMKILQMMRLLPLLKESGVFSGLLSGLI